MYLLLVGEGPLTDRVKAAYQPDPDITFLGYRSRVQGLFRISDVALVPTRFSGESYPLVVIDALLTGTPIVSTRVGSIPEMVDGPEGKAGILIDDQRDTEAFIVCLEEAMEAMLSRDTRAQYATVARELGKHSDMTAVAHSYQEIYQDLFNDRAEVKSR